jgi:hypothetical protein
MQIFLAVMNMTEAIDLLPCQMGFCGAQVFIFGVGCIIKGEAIGVDRWHLDLIIPGDLFAVEIDVPSHLSQPFYVLLFGSHSFLLSN